MLTFDCYGTLIDWEQGIWDALQPLLIANPGRDLGRRDALEAYAGLEHEIESADPAARYDTILRKVHAAFAAKLGFTSSNALDAAFGDSIAHWPAFPDSAEALRALKRHFKLVILSNVTRAGIQASARKLGVVFDAIYTAEDIGAYKPSPRNFEYLLEHLEADLGLRKDDVLHTAQSLFHDHAPAKAMGLATAWIDRQHLSEGGSWGATAKLENPPEPDFLFFTLGAMADAVEGET